MFGQQATPERFDRRVVRPPRPRQVDPKIQHDAAWARGHEKDAVRELKCFAQVMGDKEHGGRALLPELEQQTS